MSDDDEPLVIESVEQVHRIATSTRPGHPLISVVGASWQPAMDVKVPLMHRRIVSKLYVISLKRGDECGIKYGRQTYDFQESSLLCIGPGQSVVPVTEPSDLSSEHDGWTLLFHPDFLRPSGLADRMREYTFFGYDVHEALHLSHAEQQTITAIVKSIEAEYARIDGFSDDLILCQLQLLLTYCLRFYARQFITRRHAHKSVVTRLEAFLVDYFESGRPSAEGVPTVAMCAKTLGYSPDYLSDLLRRETGKNTREHIRDFLVEEAKNRLLGSRDTVSQIAFSLGFEHAHHFSKLFKSETGIAPGLYRQ
ncbi:MAG: helix-turn-helix transcriptional regulator [Myxococcota bacterium]